MGLRKRDSRFAALGKPGGKRLVSQEIEDVRQWLMSTYGGQWGTLQIASQDVQEMEKKLLVYRREIRGLKKEIVGLTR